MAAGCSCGFGAGDGDCGGAFILRDRARVVAVGVDVAAGWVSGGVDVAICCIGAAAGGEIDILALVNEISLGLRIEMTCRALYQAENLGVLTYSGGSRDYNRFSS